MCMMNELERAVMESSLYDMETKYFEVRPNIDTDANRILFRAGHERAWQAACKYKDEQYETNEYFNAVSDSLRD